MKRVYRAVTTRPVADRWGIALDGRPMRTPGKAELVVPSAALAEAIAAEWEAQQGDIRPATMPLTRLAATAIDRTTTQRALVVAEIANYAGTDLICYRAEHPPALIARQEAAWQPLIDWAIGRYDAGLAVTSGIVPQPQAPATLKAFAAAVAAQDDFRLTIPPPRPAARWSSRWRCWRAGSTPRRHLPPRSSTRPSRSRHGARMPRR